MRRLIPATFLIAITLVTGCMTGTGNTTSKISTLIPYYDFESEALNTLNELGMKGKERDYSLDQLNSGVPRSSFKDLMDATLFLLPPSGSSLVGAGLLATRSRTQPDAYGMVAGWVASNEQNPTAKHAVQNYWSHVSGAALTTLKEMGFRIDQASEHSSIEQNFGLFSEEIAYLEGRTWSLIHDDSSFGCQRSAQCVLRLAVASHFNESDATTPNNYHPMPDWFDGDVVDKDHVWRMAPKSKAAELRPVAWIARYDDRNRLSSTFDAKPFYQSMSRKLGKNSIVYTKAYSVPLGNGEWSKEPFLFHNGEQLRFLDH